MFEAVTKSGKETQDLASKISAHICHQDVILLTGNLGGGKTTFVQGLATGLAVKADVLSPTFVVAHHYEGAKGDVAFKLHHIDLYRIDDPKELEFMFTELFTELLHPIGSSNEISDSFADGKSNEVLLVEWADKLGENLPKEYLEVSFTNQNPELPDERFLRFQPVGDSWLGRQKILLEICGQYAEETT